VEKWPAGESKKTPSKAIGGHFSTEPASLLGQPFSGDVEGFTFGKGGLF